MMVMEWVRNANFKSSYKMSEKKIPYEKRNISRKKNKQIELK